MTGVDETGLYPEKILVKTTYYLDGLCPTVPVHWPIWCEDGQVVHASVEKREGPFPFGSDRQSWLQSQGVLSGSP